MTTTLAQKFCVPCRGGIPPMAADKAKELLKEVPGWQLATDARKLTRRIVLKNFVEVIKLVNQVAKIAEAEGHHPNFTVHDWNKVDFELFTHKIGGLHENDFIMAAKINELLKDFGVVK